MSVRGLMELFGVFGEEGNDAEVLDEVHDDEDVF